MKKGYVYVDFESCKTEGELRNYLDNKIKEFERLGFVEAGYIEFIFDDYLKKCVLDTKDFYSLKEEYLKKYEI